jgi:hypothetical protein
MEAYDDDMKVIRTVKPISQLERAFFKSLKWFLLSVIIGTILELYVIDDPSHLLAQVTAFICGCYVAGAVYKWYRVKTVKSAGAGISE